MGTVTETRSNGAFTVRAMQIGEDFQAQILHGRTVIGPRHSGPDADSALAAAEAWLDARTALENAERGVTGVPSVAAYREAMVCLGLNDGERAMLYAHLAAPWHKLTANELAHAAGWENWSAANLHYGGLGRKLAEFMRWTPPARPDGTPVWTMAVAMPASLEDVSSEEAVDFLMSSMETGGEFEWTLRPQVVEAIGQIASVSSSSATRSGRSTR